MLASGFWKWLSVLDAEYRLVVLIVAIVAGCAVIGFIAHAWRRGRESTERARLVRDMLDRDLTTDEITRILLASDLSEKSASKDEFDADEDPEAYLVKLLTDGWYSGKDIERILQAAGGAGQVGETAVRIVKSMADGWAGAEAIVNVLESRGRDAERSPA